MPTYSDYDVKCGIAQKGEAIFVKSGGIIDRKAVNQQKVNDIAISDIIWVDVTVTAALLDSGGSVTVMDAAGTDQFKVRDIILVGGGTSYAAGGNRTIVLTDNTTTWTTIANADIESAPSASLRWGDTKVPFATGTSDTASAAGTDIVFKYAGGTTDHSATGSIKFAVCLQKVA